MKILLDDTGVRAKLYPFTATRHTADIRVGILTIREKWAFNGLFKIYSDRTSSVAKNSAFTLPAIEANIIPTKEWMDGLLSSGVKDRSSHNIEIDHDRVKIPEHPWQLCQYNDWALRNDFKMITNGRESGILSRTNQAVSGENIFLEEGAKVEHSILNATGGPIYIGKNAEVMEGCMIRGPFALCEGAVLKMGTRIYGATTIGPFCVAGGEIKNSILFGYSNKAHDGYLGDSVIGEWCNLGAGTTSSNVKNTAGEVKVWNDVAKNYSPAGLKCGLLMGDYSRSAINTSFNTGTVVGVCCHIFGHGMPPKKTDHFTWGKEKYIFEKVLQDIDNWKKLKGHRITGLEKEILNQLYTQ